MSTKRKKVLVCVGTRPELIKLAPVIWRLRDNPQLHVRVLFTAQHRELLDQMASFFGIEADIDLDVMTTNQRLPELTARLLVAISETLEKEQPDFVVIQGDTTTVMTTALACFYARIPVGHVEAGLRTGEIYNPFPEEINRAIAGRLATLHFAPTDIEKEALLKEGIEEAAIRVTGNTVVDVLLDTLTRSVAWPDDIPRDKPYMLVTIHRRESFGEGLHEIFSALGDLATRFSDHNFIYPVHPNPNVRALAQEKLGNLFNVVLCDPMEYGTFVHLMKGATAIFTDSGGIQEEAPSLNVPVFVLREVTERPQAVYAGAARLLGTQREAIVRQAEEVLSDATLLQAMRDAPNPFGDGTAALTINQAIFSWLNQSQE